MSVVEPSLTLAFGANTTTITAGTIISYTANVAHQLGSILPRSAAAAYNLIVNVTLPPKLLVSRGRVRFNNGAAVSATVVNGNSAADPSYVMVNVPACTERSAIGRSV